LFRIAETVHVDAHGVSRESSDGRHRSGCTSTPGVAVPRSRNTAGARRERGQPSLEMPWPLSGGPGLLFSELWNPLTLYGILSSGK
jgi:hypothetical protein